MYKHQSCKELLILFILKSNKSKDNEEEPDKMKWEKMNYMNALDCLLKAEEKGNVGNGEAADINIEKCWY